MLIDLFPLKFFSPGCPLMQHAQAYYISVCEITEFALNPDEPIPNAYCGSGGPDALAKNVWKRS
jgi:hypothetical protein